MKTLNKTMVQFVLEKMNNTKPVDFIKVIYEINNYAKFLSTPLSLGMFIPTDEDGNVLEEPKITDKKYSPENNAVFRFEEKAFKLHKEAYQQAKKRVLFEGFEKCDRNLSINCIYNKKLDLHIDADFKFGKTIEDLVKYNLTLTENALKNIL